MSQVRSAPDGGLPIRIGISSCLLGEKVRWDGDHRRDRFLAEVLGPHVEWVPVCPESEVGMGVPREPVRLVEDRRGTRMVGRESGEDWTRRMRDWSRSRVRQIRALDLSGFVLKRDSPSCGMERVRLYGEKGQPRRRGQGLFAEALVAHLPLLPVEEEGRLNDLEVRESFIERVFARRRLEALFWHGWARRDVVAFHSMHKLQLMAHSPADCRRLGKLVADVEELPRGRLRAQYETGFMGALRHRATRRRQGKVLQHCLGSLRDRLDGETRAAVRAVVEEYQAGLTPLVVPVTLIRHYVQLLDIESLAGQTWLEPHPKELMLRNHA